MQVGIKVIHVERSLEVTGEVKSRCLLPLDHQGGWLSEKLLKKKRQKGILTTREVGCLKNS